VENFYQSITGGLQTEKKQNFIQNGLGYYEMIRHQVWCEEECEKCLDHKRWIGHILYRNCLPKYVIEGQIEWAGRRKQLLDDLKENRRY